MWGTQIIVVSAANPRSTHTVRVDLGTATSSSALSASAFLPTPDISLLPVWSKAEKDNFTLRVTLEGNSPGIPPVRLPAGTRNEPSEDMPLEMPDSARRLPGGLWEYRPLPTIPA